MKFLDEWRQKYRQYIELTKVDEIGRRFFVMNAFDGGLTILGTIVGAYFSGLLDPAILISVALGSSVAMSMSGLFGAYLAESAEQRARIQELEKNMLVSLDDSIITRSGRFASVYVAVIDSLAPLLASQISMLPIYLSLIIGFPIRTAMEYSMVLVGVILFLLGVFNGRIAKENLWISGVKMVLVGVATFMIFVVLTLF